MFHLDEYVGLDENHKASFRKYLKEKFTSKVPLKNAFFVDGTKAQITALTEELKKAPIDVGVIGIGENAHIAFNDPPANFDTEEAYIIVNLDDACKNQQVGEGWFPSVEDVPKQAVFMSVKQILKCRNIVSCVPYTAKANAIYNTSNQKVNPNVPGTILKTHKSFVLYADANSASKVINPDIFR